MKQLLRICQPFVLLIFKIPSSHLTKIVIRIIGSQGPSQSISPSVHGLPPPPLPNQGASCYGTRSWSDPLRGHSTYPSGCSNGFPSHINQMGLVNVSQAFYGIWKENNQLHKWCDCLFLDPKRREIVFQLLDKRISKRRWHPQLQEVTWKTPQPPPISGFVVGGSILQNLILQMYNNWSL